MNMHTLIAAIIRERAPLDALLEQLAAQGLLTTPAPDGWTPAVHLAHITLWEALLVGWLRLAAQGVPPAPSINAVVALMDEVNARCLLDNRDRPVAEIRAAAARVHQELLDTLRALPNEEEDPAWHLWRDARAPWTLIVGNTTEHYEEHVSYLTAWHTSRNGA